MSVNNLWPLLVLVILGVTVGVIWGAFRLAWRWVKDPVGRVFIGLAISLVCIVGLGTAFVAGCTYFYIGTSNSTHALPP